MPGSKGKLFYKILAALVAAAIIVPTAAYASSPQALSDLEDELEEDQSELEDVEEEIDELSEQKTAAEQAIEELDTQLNEISEQLDSLNEQVAAKEQEIADNQVKLDAARTEEVEQYDSMKARIKYLYENSQQSVLQILLEADSLTEFVNKAALSNEIVSYDREKLAEYTEIKKQIAELEDKLEQEEAELKTMQAQVEEELAEVESVMSEKEQLLSETVAGIENAMSEQEQIQARIEEDEAAIKKAKAAMAAGQYVYSESWDGTFIWPSAASTRITSYYGNRTSPTAGASSYHRGLDIGAAYGSDILSAADGIVTAAYYSSSGGNMVMISHGDGMFTVYMHASKLCVSKGDYVDQGDVIAKVGSTGISTGAHLHFGVMVNGSYVDPLNYF